MHTHTITHPDMKRRLLVGGMLAMAMLAQPLQAQDKPQASAPATAAKASPYLPSRPPASAGGYYQAMWGVDNLLVRRTASDNLIRFSYRVVDPARAKALANKSSTPYMVGQRSHAVLHVPVMDKIGQLRQSGTAEVGKEYWMVFSNKGNLVRAGDRVNVIIGSFHVDGLVVE